MEFNLFELLNIYKSQQLNEFLVRTIGNDLTESNLSYRKIKKNWNFVGNNSSNASVINIIKNGEKGIVERITNAMDAVLEKQKVVNNVTESKTSADVIRKSFPEYYQNIESIVLGKTGLSPLDALDQVTLAINDGSKSNKPTFDIIDRGTGIPGASFVDTILSINKGNKLSRDKGYLIGAFGQGGSTSLPFADATMIVSKYDGIYYFTIVKSVDLEEFKNYCFVYLVFEGKVGTAEYNGEEFKDEYINRFVKQESGTLVRMIETDITKTFRESDISNPGSFGDYVNTELFSAPLPLRIVENREIFKENDHSMNQNIYGSFLKMHAWDYNRNKYAGSIMVDHKSKMYKVDYYFILPPDENKWCNDSECKEIFKQVNVHLQPIIYTVNGQYIAGEKYLKLKNAGLNFLQYRLLVVINLDILGMEKYKFFTSDRSQIRDSDLTHGFIDTVIEKLKNEEKIVEINNIIAKKSINSVIDNEVIRNITSKVKHIYNKYLEGNGVLKISSEGNVSLQEEVFYDYVSTLQILTSKKKYYKDQIVNILLRTGANRIINQTAPIKVYLKGRSTKKYTVSILNGKLQYAFTNLAPGDYKIHFSLYEGTIMQLKTPNFEFTILDEVSPEKVESKEKYESKTLNLKIIPVETRDLIVDVVKNMEEKTITTYVCLEHEAMNEVYGKSSSNDIQLLKNKLIEPVVLFALSMKEKYDDIETIEEKNELIVSLAKTIAFSLAQK